VVAPGALAEPVVPELPGLDRFAGARFHSARWDHGFVLAGKKVAVIGTGASAVQFDPTAHLMHRPVPTAVPVAA
jgi:cation diffusion facilitator CzcD-associated flavoprotein CzcO